MGLALSPTSASGGSLLPLGFAALREESGAHFYFDLAFLSEKFRCGAIITFEQYLAIFLLMRLLNTCVLIFGREGVFLGEGGLAHCQVFGAPPHLPTDANSTVPRISDNPVLCTRGQAHVQLGTSLSVSIRKIMIS